MYVSVYLFHALRDFDQAYTYILPEKLAEEACGVGHLVLVPFGRGRQKPVLAVVAEVLTQAPVVETSSQKPIQWKKVAARVGKEPLYTAEHLALAKEMKRRYFCSIGAALSAMVPTSLARIQDFQGVNTRFVSLADPEDVEARLEQSDFRSVQRRDVCLTLLEEGELRLDELAFLTSVSESTIRAMIKDGTLVSEVRRVSKKEEALVGNPGGEGLNQGRSALAGANSPEGAVGSYDTGEAQAAWQPSGLEAHLNQPPKVLNPDQNRVLEGLITMYREPLAKFSTPRPELDPRQREKGIQGGDGASEPRKEEGKAPEPRKEEGRAPEPRKPEQEKGGTLDLTPQPLLLKEALLWGVTGSGKTEVYLRLAQEVLKSGKTVLILVSEIALTPLLIARVQSFFHEEAAVLHSRLTLRERYQEWQDIMTGKKKIALGARSACFAPLENLGLILIDEEQESSYRSDQKPMYDARTIARMRGIFHGAMVVSVSATPSLTTYYRCIEGKSRLFRLPRKATFMAPNTIVPVDLRKNRREMVNPYISKTMLEYLQRCLQKGGQAMLFLNRRGHSRSLQCTYCGHILSCDFCDMPYTPHLKVQGPNSYFVPLTDLRESFDLECHYCGALKKMPKVCPVCGQSFFFRRGIGTQQLEAWFSSYFPQYTVARLDTDTSRHFQGIIEDFAAGKIQCLIGTQMIAKGHDFPHVRLMGVVSADDLLVGRDFHSSERCFQLLQQSFGRPGRAQEAGEVVVQAYDWDNYALTHAIAGDMEGFMAEELTYRQDLAYPPFGHLAQLTYSSPVSQHALEEAMAGQAFLSRFANRPTPISTELDQQGPPEPMDLNARAPSPRAPSPIAPEVEVLEVHRPYLRKLRSRYRFTFMVKTQNEGLLYALCSQEDARKKRSDVYLRIEID